MFRDLLLLISLFSFTLAQSGADPYAPVYTTCPSSLKIRKASDVPIPIPLRHYL